MIGSILIMLSISTVLAFFFICRELIRERKEADRLWNQVKVYQERFRHMSSLAEKDAS